MIGSSSEGPLEKARKYAEMAEEMFGNKFYRDACYFSYQALNSFLQEALLRTLEIQVQAHRLSRLYEMLADNLGAKVNPEVWKCLDALSDRHVSERRHQAQITELPESEGRLCLDCLHKALEELEGMVSGRLG